MVLAAIFGFALRNTDGGAANMMQDLVWQIPAAMIGVFAVSRILQAPYRAYKELQEEKRRLREGVPLTLEQVNEWSQRTPSLRVEQGEEESTGPVVRGWGLTVWNDEGQEVRGVHANLEAVDTVYPANVSLDWLPTNCDLHWARQGEEVGFTIPGGQSARLNVFYQDQATKHLKLSYHRTTEDFRERHNLFFDFPVLILINITGEGRTPVFAVCRIEPKSAKDQIYEGLSKKPSFALLGSRIDRPSLRDFQSNEETAPEDNGEED